jgi:succinoglycan biosynthesis transport protein ExoP
MATSQKLFDVSVRDLLYVVFRYKWLIATVAILVLAGVTLYTYIIPEKYTSEARILVKVGRESLAVDPSISGPTMGMLVNRDAEVRSEVAILENRALIKKAVADAEALLNAKPDEMGAGGIKGALRGVRSMVRGTIDSVLYGLDLKTKLSPEDEAIQNVIDNLTVEAERNTNTVYVSYDAPGAEMAEQVLTRIVSLYLDEHIDVHSSLATPEFFEQRTAELKEALQKADDELESYRASNGIINLNSQKDALLERINSLMMDGRNLRAQRDGSAARLAALEDAMKGRSKNHVTESRIREVSPIRDNITTVITDLKNQEKAMAELYPDTHRPLITLREQIAQTQSVIDAEPETRAETVTAVDTVFQDLTVAVAQEKGEYESRKAAFDSLSGSLEEAQAELAKLATLETELSRLERQMEVADSEYTAYRDNLKRSRINEALDTAKVSNLAVVQAPTRPVEPSYPNKPMNIGLGILVGLFAGLCLAFLLDYMNDSLNTTDRVERKLGVPVLAALSKEDYDACT